MWQHFTFPRVGSSCCKNIPLAPQCLAAIKNACVTATWFPIEFEWLLKWRWLRDYYTAALIKSVVHHANNVCRARIMWIVDKKPPESHLRLQQWLWMQHRLEIVAAASDTPLQWSPQFPIWCSFQFTCHCTILLYPVLCAIWANFYVCSNHFLLHSSLLQPLLRLCVWKGIFQGPG